MLTLFDNVPGAPASAAPGDTIILEPVSPGERPEQVVDGNWGVHAVIKKKLFAATDV